MIRISFALSRNSGFKVVVVFQSFFIGTVLTGRVRPVLGFDGNVQPNGLIRSFKLQYRVTKTGYYPYIITFGVVHTSFSFLQHFLERKLISTF